MVERRSVQTSAVSCLNISSIWIVRLPTSSARVARCQGRNAQFCMSGIKIVGYVCDSEGRHPDSAKVEKIIAWRPCDSAKEVKAFLGVCVYYRIWIRDFSIRAGPLYRLLKKGVVFK